MTVDGDVCWASVCFYAVKCAHVGTVVYSSTSCMLLVVVISSQLAELYCVDRDFEGKSNAVFVVLGCLFSGL